LKPERLSASSIACFESCEARFFATYIEKGREPGGRAANLGTACHEALEWLVVERVMKKLPYTRDEVMTKLDFACSALGLDTNQKKQAIEMVDRFLAYQDENGWNEVICAESKETFTLTHPRLGSIPVTYIWDRGDMLPGNVIDVVDYKTYARPMSPDEMHSKVQNRLYALAAAIKFKDIKPERIWVTLWLLRYGPISAVFTRQDNQATWRYLRDVWERIDASDGTIETINSECKWCVRKSACETLQRHVAVGGINHLSDRAAVELLAETQNRMTALANLRTELEGRITDIMDAEETTEIKYEGVRVYIKPTNRREVDSERVAKVVGPELMAKYGSVGVTTLDTMIKTEPSITPDMKIALKRLFRNKPGSKLEIEVSSPFDDL